MNYDKKLYAYLIYLKTCIVRFIKVMNDFNPFYTYFLSVLFNCHYHCYYHNNSTLLLYSFNELKHNYLFKHTPYLNS